MICRGTPLLAAYAKEDGMTAVPLAENQPQALLLVRFAGIE
jgi:hypothetical protein